MPDPMPLATIDAALAHAGVSAPTEAERRSVAEASRYLVAILEHLRTPPLGPEAEPAVTFDAEGAAR
jgi:hypothetical protein